MFVFLSAKRLLRLTVVLLFFSYPSLAQEFAIKGRVLDEGGKPLLGNTYISYQTKKIVAQSGTGTFNLRVEGTSETFNKELVEATRPKFALKSVDFDKESKQLTLVMVDAKENSGTLLDEAGTPMAGATIIFSANNYKEKVISSSNGGKFTIHVPKNIEVANGLFSINGNTAEAKDVNVESLGNGTNRLILTYRPPKKAPDNEKLASPKGISYYKFLLEEKGKRNPIANLKATVDGKTYTTDVDGKITLEKPVKANIDPILAEYLIVSNSAAGENALIVIKKQETEVEDIFRAVDPFKAGFKKIEEELNNTKDLLKIKNERIREEISKVEKRLETDKSLSPDQRKQFSETLINLKETLTKNEEAYSRINTGSEEVLSRIQVIISDKQDSLEALKELNALLEEKNQAIEEARAEEAAKFRNQILLFGGIALIFGLAAIFLFILSRRLDKQKKELAEILAQVQQQKAQIEAQNTLLQTQKEEIERKNVRLEDLDREKNSLMNIVAHDLKAPLNKVAGAAQLLPNLGDLNEDQEEFVNMIKKVAVEGKKFIEDLLDINAIEQQKPEAITWEKIKLEQLISTSIIGYKQQAENKKIVLHLDSQLNGTDIEADRSYLNRILDNLVSNAIKFSPQEKNIYITATENGKHVHISIKDEGPGISEADQKKMFKKFQKLSARPTSGESSTGLGLSIIKTLVERLHGEINVNSELGKGTEFVVTLPKEKVA